MVTQKIQKSNEKEVSDCIVEEMKTKYDPHAPRVIAKVPNHAARFPQGPHATIPSSGKVNTPPKVESPRRSLEASTSWPLSARRQSEKLDSVAKIATPTRLPRSPACMNAHGSSREAAPMKHFVKLTTVRS
jgi:hypothetical protein